MQLCCSHLNTSNGMVLLQPQCNDAIHSNAMQYLYEPNGEVQLPPQRRPQNPSPFPLISHQMHPPTFQFFNFSTLLKCKLITNEFIITITPNAPASFSIIQKCKSHQMQINHKNASQSQIIIITPAFPKTDHK